MSAFRLAADMLGVGADERGQIMPEPLLPYLLHYLIAFASA